MIAVQSSLTLTFKLSLGINYKDNSIFHVDMFIIYIRIGVDYTKKRFIELGLDDNDKMKKLILMPTTIDF